MSTSPSHRGPLIGGDAELDKIAELGFDWLWFPGLGADKAGARPRTSA